MTSCELCRAPFDNHLVLKKEMKILGRKVEMPIGWLCPGQEKAPTINVITGGGGNGGVSGGGGGGATYSGPINAI